MFLTFPTPNADTSDGQVRPREAEAFLLIVSKTKNNDI